MVADVIPGFSGVTAELIDISSTEPPPSVFAVPTYLLEGRVLYLGNPSRQELKQKLSLILHQSPA